ncbi:Uncharacterized protein GBIM_07547 [Gryllus bimaculatus]|nr:Uncharacterized protein GBIM_07547 [Gryllus bimaculatus]
MAGRGGAPPPPTDCPPAAPCRWRSCCRAPCARPRHDAARPGAGRTSPGEAAAAPWPAHGLHRGRPSPEATGTCYRAHPRAPRPPGLPPGGVPPPPCAPRVLHAPGHAAPGSSEWGDIELDIRQHIQQCSCTCNHMGYGNFMDYQVGMQGKI